MPDIIRDAILGQMLRLISPRILPYADEKPGYIIPIKYRRHFAGQQTDFAESADTLVVSVPIDPKKGKGQDLEKGAEEEDPDEAIEVLKDGAAHLGETPRRPRISTSSRHERGIGNMPRPAQDAGQGEVVIVDWDGPDDPDRPHNWSWRKRGFAISQITFLTFSVYIGSAIYVPAIPGIQEVFGASATQATWGMTLFILAYGLGPMFLAPLQDHHRLGRNPVYIGGLFIFILFQLPIIWAKNLAMILVFRFLTGFFGSPALATGGASIGDMVEPWLLPIWSAAWALGAICGPVIGPVIGGFAAMEKGWKWPIYELTWLASVAFLLLFTFFPETHEAKILTDRAHRLRKLTGNQNLRSQAEVDASRESSAEFWKFSLLQPFKLAGEPAVLFANSYMALVYMIFYMWFESFNIVFNEGYGFTLGIGGLPYLGFLVAAAIAFPLYLLYQVLHIAPRFAKHGSLEPEVRLEIAFIGACIIPVSIITFGWTSLRTHWMAPVVFAALYLPGIFFTFQGILMYLALSYPPRDAASVLAGNDLFRSAIASFAPLYGGKFFRSKIGLGGGSTLLAGVAAAMIPIMFALIKKGKSLRARSRYAHG